MASTTLGKEANLASKIKGKPGRPEPFNFKHKAIRVVLDPSPYSGYKGQPYVIWNNQFISVGVFECVGIDETGAVARDLVYNPENSAWFLAKCHAASQTVSGASWTRRCEIITDGEVFYSVKQMRRGGRRLSANPKPDGIDLKKCTRHDKALVHEAIKSYIDYHMRKQNAT